MRHTQMMIIGSGPAGCTAAIYASRAGLTTTVMEGMQPGGQLTITTQIDNYPGFSEGVDANELMDSMRAQAERFGAQMLASMVTGVNLGERPFRVWTDGEEEWTADTLVIATGSSAKYLGLPDEQRYLGMGVSTCATCDGFFYRHKVVAVVGGGDTACEEAAYLATLASKVYMIVRKPFLRASQIMQERVMRAPNIDILFENTPTGLYGEDKLQGLHLAYRAGKEDEKLHDLDIDGLFLAIGHHPNSGLFAQWLPTDEAGYIKTTDGTPCTDIQGVYAAGDVADPRYRQAIIAAGSGAKAAMEAEKYLKQNPDSRRQ